MLLILASSSPRRREILALLGLPFETIAPNFAETPSSHRPAEDEVLDFALGKAQSVAKNNPAAIVIGSDTMILIDGDKIGKPSGVENAREILRALSGKSHRILTSVAILDPSTRAPALAGSSRSGFRPTGAVEGATGLPVGLHGTGGPGLLTVEEVSVKMRAFTDPEIERYLSCNEFLDKAGAYSIQGEGRALIESIRGDYLAAVGLPLKPIAGYLASRGIRIPLDVEKFYAGKSFRNWGAF